MARLNSYLKKRGRTYYLHYFENGVRQRLNLGTEDAQIAKKKQRVFDSTRVRGEDNPLPTQTLIGIDGLVDGLVADAHARVVRVFQGQAVAHLLGRPPAGDSLNDVVPKVPFVEFLSGRHALRRCSYRCWPDCAV